jgi:prophage regulatory protein
MNSSADRLLGTKDVCEQLNITRGTLRNWVRQGTFPPALKLGPRKIGWRPTVVEHWLVHRELAEGPAKSNELFP